MKILFGDWFQRNVCWFVLVRELRKDANWQRIYEAERKKPLNQNKSSHVRSQCILCRACLQWNHVTIILNIDVVQVVQMLQFSYLQTQFAKLWAWSLSWSLQTTIRIIIPSGSALNFNNYVYTTVWRTICSGFSVKVWEIFFGALRVAAPTDSAWLFQ